MSMQSQLEKRFSGLGGRFLVSAEDLAERLRSLRAIVFDWDGVFNVGAKGEGVASTFNEADSMGVNLWRYAIWRRHGVLPVTAVITGQDNPSARRFAQREHFTVVYSGVLNKSDAVAELIATHGLNRQQVACVFDDVNDLGMAAACGLRFMVRRDSSPILQAYAVERRLCDYMTAAASGHCAVREIAELALAVCGDFDEVAASRMAFDESYTRYFSARQAVETELAKPAST